jgi:hypothetical protein
MASAAAKLTRIRRAGGREFPRHFNQMEIFLRV